MKSGLPNSSMLSIKASILSRDKKTPTTLPCREIAKLSFRINLGRLAWASVTLTVDSLFIICIIRRFAYTVKRPKFNAEISAPPENPSVMALQNSFAGADEFGERARLAR